MHLWLDREYDNTNATSGCHPNGHENNLCIKVTWNQGSHKSHRQSLHRNFLLIVIKLWYVYSNLPEGPRQCSSREPYAEFLEYRIKLCRQRRKHHYNIKEELLQSLFKWRLKSYLHGDPKEPKMSLNVDFNRIVE